MIEQLSFAELLAAAKHHSRATDPATSRIAGSRERPTLRARCYETLCDAWPDGMTDDRLAHLLGVPSTSAGKRRLELQRAGMVEPLYELGQQVVRPTRYGSPALVWRAVRVQVDVDTGGRV